MEITRFEKEISYIINLLGLIYLSSISYIKVKHILLQKSRSYEKKISKPCGGKLITF